MNYGFRQLRLKVHLPMRFVADALCGADRIRAGDGLYKQSGRRGKFRAYDLRCNC